MNKAVIFDFDGTIIDSESHWPGTMERMFQMMGVPWEPEHHRALNGQSLENCYKIMRERHGITMPFETYRDVVFSHADDIYHVHADVSPGTFALMDRLEEMKIDRAIASSNQRVYIDIAMRRLKLDTFFPLICSAEDTPGKHKPDPALFLLAAEKLGRKPQDCVGLEDSVAGVAAVKAAEMLCVAVRGPHNGHLDLSKADLEISHFDQLTRERLAELLS